MITMTLYMSVIYRDKLTSSLGPFTLGRFPIDARKTTFDHHFLPFLSFTVTERTQSIVFLHEKSQILVVRARKGEFYRDWQVFYRDPFNRVARDCLILII